MASDLVLHLEEQGKSARVSLRPLPQAHPSPDLRSRTTTGPISLVRLTNGLNPHLDPKQLKSQDLVESDPEITPGRAGQILEPELLSTAYYDAQAEDPQPISDFKFTDIILGPEGEEKERRPHLTRRSNLNDLLPIKLSKRIPLQQALTQFIFKLTYQIVHEDGVTLEFLFNIAQDLDQKQELALVGAGSKGNQPLVIREKGSPYRGFLYGEIGSGEDEGKYKLLLLLSDQELRQPSRK